MTDYLEEQSNELEALESIYPDELHIISRDPPKFQIPISAEYLEYHDKETASCCLEFIYTASYPDEAPEMDIVDVENLDDQNQTVLLDFMKETAEENLGMVMVFTIVSEMQERLTQMVEQIYTEKKEAIERAEKEKEEAERKKFEGTRVTIETFVAWKKVFDAEMNEKKRKIIEADTTRKKLTGKELFLTNQAIEDSEDLDLNDGGQAVDVDESLFQDLDDLELDELES